MRKQAPRFFKEETGMNSREMPLTRVPMGARASVTGLSAEGAERRRMLDLGVIAGTAIRPLYRSPSGNPVAYLIRGAVIALRAADAAKILVTA
jgi:ferrous iron transport protein A